MRFKFYVILLTVVVLVFSSINRVVAQDIKPSALKQMSSLILDKKSWTSAQKKMSSHLIYAMRMDRGEKITSEVATLLVDAKKDANGKVQVEITADVTPALLQEIVNAGGDIIAKFENFRSISARIPIQQLERIASLNDVTYMYPYYPPEVHGYIKRMVNSKNTDSENSEKVTERIPLKREVPVARPTFEQRASNVRQKLLAALAGQVPFTGSINSQGDATHKAALARTTFGVNGTGIKIGVISDCATPAAITSSQGTGNLPATVTVLPGQAGTGNNEGVAMMEIVFDIAPGAQLFFATANPSPAQFAQNILDLRAAGCDIIVDDIIYLNESPFQDGIIAQAVNTVTAAGALYFSSAGNEGNKNDGTSGVWEGDFVSGGTIPLADPAGGVVHDFGGGVTNNLVTFTAARGVLFWSDPLGGSNNDYDLFVLNNAQTAVVSSSLGAQTGTQDPWEFIGAGAATNTRMVVWKDNAAAVRALHVSAFRGELSISTQGHTHGHSAAVNAYSVAATPAAAAGCSGFPNGPSTTPFTAANKVECFSADGPRRMFYNANGTQITPGNILFGTNGGVVRQKPDITAADGVAVTGVGGFGSPFYGTSAAAPHAAAIAGLLKSFRPALTPAQVRTALTSTAIDIEAAGTDRDAGVGIVMAFEALQSVSGPTVTINQAAAQPDPTTVSPINFTVVFSAAVTGFDQADVTLSGTAGATTKVVTGSGTTYNVAVSGMTGSGTVIATVPAGGAIDGSSFPNLASTSTDNTVTFNVPPGPSVTINQAGAQADPTIASPINFTVVFSEAVTGFDQADVTLSGTAGATTKVVTGSGTTYNVAVSGMTSNGTVIATVPAGGAINGSSVANIASTSTDNSVLFSAFPSTVTINQAAAQADPTVVSPINFTVVFNEAVTGFATGDVTLSGTAGATTATVTGSGTTYNVAVSGMTAGGTVIADIAAGVAVNAGGVGNLAATFTDNSVTFNNTPPTVTINQAAAQADPTSASPINFTVVFNEPVTGFATGDVTLSGTALATTATVTGSGTTYNVAVTGMTATGTVIANIAAGVANDIDGNGNTAATFTDNTVTFNSCVLVCPANVTVPATAGQCGAIVNYPAPSSTGGCGTVTATPAAGSFFPVGTTTVNVSTTSGASCSFTVTVTDTQAPVVTCPGNITVSNTPNLCSAVVNFTPTAVDNCSQFSFTQSSSNTGAANNAAACPTGLTSWWRAYQLAAPSPITMDKVTFGIEIAEATAATKPITVRLYTSAGAFPGGVLTQVASQVFNLAPQTNTLFTGTFTTPAVVPGNSILVVEVSSDVTQGRFFIGGNTLPETAPSFISSVACGIATPATAASIGFPDMHIILNVSGFIPLTITSVPASGSVFPVGPATTVTTTATDASGNSSSCTFTVKVNDTQAPVLTCPNNLTANTPVGSCTAAVTYVVPTATDNCTGTVVTRTAGPASGSAFPIGVTTVTHTATDASGNITTCSFTVTVTDIQLPVITAQPANRTVCNGLNTSFTVTATNAVSYQWQQYIGGVWTNVAGATAASLPLNAVTLGMNTNSYRVNVIGLCSSVTSGFATLFVNPLPTINLTATSSPVLLPTQSTSIVATVVPTGGTFAWFKNGAALVPAVTGGTLSNLTVDNAGTYRAVYTDPNGCVNTSADLVVSAEASTNLYIAPNPNYGQFSVRYYNQTNEPLIVSVFNSNGARVYQKTAATTLSYTKIDVDLLTNAPGIYLVELRNASGILLAHKKVVVSHK